MIGSLKGIITEKNVGSLLIDVGGIGYAVLISPRTFDRVPPLGESVQLKIHTHVREDEITLFGFLEILEKTLFQRMIKVSGIGPKMDLNILSGISSEDFLATVHTEDVDKLTSIPGIGKKMAARILVDLKDKLQDLSNVTRLNPQKSNPFQDMADDVISALVNLGYNKTVSEKTVTQLKISDNKSLESLIREALQDLAGAR